MRGFVRFVAGAAAAGLWVWFYHGVQFGSGILKPALYVTGAIAAFALVSWLVGKGYEVFTGVP